MSDRPRRPAVLLVSEENADHLLDEFGRYARDYDVRAARSFSLEAGHLVKELRGEGASVVPLVHAWLEPQTS